MSNCPFCNLDPTPDAPPPTPRPTLLRRAWKGTHWLVPSLLLALIPKCPMCVAAYIALFTGVGISINAAHWIQLLLWAFCLISIAYLVITRIPLFLRSRNVHRPSHAR